MSTQLPTNGITNLPAVTQVGSVPALMDCALAVSDMQRQIVLMQQHMKENMKDGEHFGTIPGCGSKPSLLKSGAEKLCFIFQLSPKFEVTQRELPRDHREIQVKCYLYSRVTGAFFGEGLGCCSTMEAKYRFRNADRVCPGCGKATVFKSKNPGEGYYCWKRKDGCGATFAENDSAIVNQNAGKVEHDNPADYYNTVLKIAKKRAQVDATLTVTAASDIFTQDVEDFSEEVRANPIPPRAPASPLRNDQGGVRPAVKDLPENPWLHEMEGPNQFQHTALFLIEEAKFRAIAKPPKLASLIATSAITDRDAAAIQAANKDWSGRYAAESDHFPKSDIADQIPPGASWDDIPEGDA